MLRGRIRKLGLEQGFNVLCENASDKEYCVRFAVLNSKDAESITDYPKSVIADATVGLAEKA